MKKLIKSIPVMTIEEFGELENLEMEIHERRVPIPNPSRYYACFKGVEVKDGPILCSNFGNGDTQEEAIKNYTKNIELECLVFDAYSSNRRVFYAPRFKEVIK